MRDFEEEFKDAEYDRNVAQKEIALIQAKADMLDEMISACVNATLAMNKSTFAAKAEINDILSKAITKAERVSQ